MRTFIILSLMLLFKFSNGQDTIRRYEFGSTLFTFNPIISPDDFAPDRPDIELINGLIFRYSKKDSDFELLQAIQKIINLMLHPLGRQTALVETLITKTLELV